MEKYKILMSLGDGKLLVLNKETNENEVISSELFYGRKGAL
jgi:hypothetical protein